VDNELEVIHHQMEDTRSSLADKLDTLENEILGTVHNATAAVAHTVEDVKSAVSSVTETLQETVENVKETLNVSEQVRHHPWGMLGGAAVAGFLGGWLIGSSRREKEPAAPKETRREPSAAARREEPAADHGSIFAALQPLIGVGLGAVMGAVRDMIAGALPENVKGDVAEALDKFTVQLGGKPLASAEDTSGETRKPLERKEPANGKHASTEGRDGGAEPTEPTGRDRGGSRFR